ncbi:hypothetical protein [Methylobacterium radiotolerans]|uniref:hypothetical protein n=1 Tax=Methylobacterium radiotolerans TaxID=31998 RepID=UPI00097705D5|nr:hypothetical protein [Methylobacterium radiotolerans]MCX4197653.1 hypothetical protein [Methylobacterium organophilum]ONF49665.1 signal peptide protein [Methylobacterium radiotolerans]
MTRIIAAILTGLASVPASSGTGQAADLAPFQGSGPAPTPGRWHTGAGGRVAGTVAARGRPEYSYYGEYGYPAPFGYGYAYAPVPSRGFEYGYNGPRYVWTAPDSYSGPAFGYHVW